MKVFLICPVRGISKKYHQEIENAVHHIEAQGHTVHWPERDTNQDDPTGGLNICRQNREAIQLADMVYVIWDGLSQGVLFDLGMAFAMEKFIKVVPGMFPPDTTGKSFQNMVYAWAERGYV